MRGDRQEAIVVLGLVLRRKDFWDIPAKTLVRPETDGGVWPARRLCQIVGAIKKPMNWRNLKKMR